TRRASNSQNVCSRSVIATRDWEVWRAKPSKSDLFGAAFGQLRWPKAAPKELCSGAAGARSPCWRVSQQDHEWMYRWQLGCPTSGRSIRVCQEQGWEDSMCGKKREKL